MGRVVEFDGLRGLAAVGIMLLHLRRFPASPWSYSLVDLFFVLSGALVTANALKHQRAGNFLPVFLARRALRIWPLYYLAFAACLLLNQFLAWDKPPTAWPYFLTFTQGSQEYLRQPSPPFSGMFLHTWTLAIEEQFYVVLPLLLVAMGRRCLPILAVGCLAIAPWMRAEGFSPYLLLSRGDGLAMGSLLAVLLSNEAWVGRHVRAIRYSFGAMTLTALAAPPILGLVWKATPTLGPYPDGATVGDALFTTRACFIYAGLAGLILVSPGHWAFRPLRNRRLAYLGTVSYALYLLHPLVYATFPGLYRFYVIQGLGIRSRRLMDVATLTVCFALAEASRRWLEGPLQDFKEHLRYSPLYPFGGRMAPRRPHFLASREGIRSLDSPEMVRGISSQGRVARSVPGQVPGAASDGSGATYSDLLRRTDLRTDRES